MQARETVIINIKSGIAPYDHRVEISADATIGDLKKRYFEKLRTLIPENSDLSYLLLEDLQLIHAFSFPKSLKDNQIISDVCGEFHFFNDNVTYVIKARKEAEKAAIRAMELEEAKRNSLPQDMSDSDDDTIGQYPMVIHPVVVRPLPLPLPEVGLFRTASFYPLDSIRCDAVVPSKRNS